MLSKKKDHNQSPWELTLCQQKIKYLGNLLEAEIEVVFQKVETRLKKEGK